MRHSNLKLKTIAAETLSLFSRHRQTFFDGMSPFPADIQSAVTNGITFAPEYCESNSFANRLMSPFAELFQIPGINADWEGCNFITGRSYTDFIAVSPDTTI